MHNSECAFDSLMDRGRVRLHGKIESWKGRQGAQGDIIGGLTAGVQCARACVWPMDKGMYHYILSRSLVRVQVGV